MSAQKRTASSAAGGLLGLVGLSALAGVLVTAAVTPALAVTGMAANNSISLFENLPGYLEVQPLTQKSDIYATNPDGSAVHLATFFDDNREEVAWDQMSQFLKDAAVAGEDPRFYEHGGVDIQGTVRAALNEYVIGGATQGGSSITQQYVKNVLLNNAVREAKTDEERQEAIDSAIETTPERKLKEIRYAIALEKKTPKDEILRGYLNIAFFGGRVYGVESASMYYFGKHASEVSPAEAASLIAITNNPEKFRLDRPDSEANGAATVDKAGNPVPYAANKERRDYILDRMLEYKKITQEDHDAAIATPVAPVITPPSTGCQSAPGNSAYFCDYVVNVVQHAYDDPATPDVNEGTKLLRQGGLQIYTTLDMELQAVAEQAMAENVPMTDPEFDVGSVAVSVKVGTGEVLAMTQNKRYSQDPDVLASSPEYSAINYSTDFDYGGSSGFQPGSTFKVFTLGEWLNEGHSLRESFNGSRRNFTSFPAACYGGWSGSFDPKNDDSTNANNAVDATKYSVNTAFIAMGQQLDLCKIKDFAQAFGVKRADGLELGQKFEYDDNGPVYNEDGTRKVNPDAVFGPSAILGTEEVAPLSMVEAYAGIANNGMTCKPVVITKIVQADGSELAPPAPECWQSTTPEVAHGMAYAMQQTFSGTAAQSNTYTGVPHIGKTGTTDGNEGTWMNGASTKVATVTWVGNATGHANLRQISFDSGSAATARHRMWSHIMEFADNKYGGDEFPEPDASAFRQVLVDIPQVAGLTFDQAKQAIEAAGFVAEDGGQQDSNLPAGQVSGTDPSGQAGKGTTIRIFTSNGSMKAVPNVVGMQADAAENALKNAGYKVQKQNEDTTDPSKVGLVLSQNPGADASAKQGDTVTIVIGKLGAGGGDGGNGNDG
ncbi:transglycosylase domain-containing protein [Agromyces soli]